MRSLALHAPPRPAPTAAPAVHNRALSVPVPRALPFAEEPARERHDPARVFDAGLRNHHLANTAYPIRHRKTIWRFRVDDAHHAEHLAARFRGDDPMMLYAHIPFCEARCRFCDYCVIPAHTAEQERDYGEALLKELEDYARLIDQPGKALVGFDIGGGTPALVDPALIGRLMERVHAHFTLVPGTDVSIETTPKIAAKHPERLKAYRAFGIDRISMGLQTVSRRLLERYGRELNAGDDNSFNKRATEHIRAAGFDRFNIDLMYGFANQGVEDFVGSLRYAMDLEPEYITLYRMRYKGTRVRGEMKDVHLDDVHALSDAAHRELFARGYVANDGKNTFSRVKDDTGCSAYLTERVINATPYLGLGVGAQTYANNLLGYNIGAKTKKMEKYVEAVHEGRPPVQDLYLLPPSEGMAKMVAVSFYFGEIDRAAFRARFGTTLEAAFPDEVAYVLERGLMHDVEGKLRLTHEGARVYNGVIALFYSDRVKGYLLGLE
jgi:oxygen-independent coproporphyrinogen-3 oxidase